MNIKCQAENYKYKIVNDKVVFYNELYDNGLFKLLICAIADAFLPNTHSFDLPIAVEAHHKNNDIALDENLEIRGTDEYTYFVPVEHYNKWKKTYALVYWCMIALGLFVSGILMYIFLGPSRYNWIVAIAFILVTAMSVYLIYKILKQLRRAKKYKHIDTIHI